jgi:hypothetical protein
VKRYTMCARRALRDYRPGAVRQVPVTDHDPPCPLCGGRVTYRGMLAIECVTVGCANGGPAIDLDALARDILAALAFD